MMQNAAALGMVFGPFLAIVGIWLFVNALHIQKVYTVAKANSPVAYVQGMINLLLGLFILHVYNVWVWDLGFFVTLLGWFLLIRGLLILFFPQFIFDMSCKSEKTVRLWGVILFIWGLIICKIGFFPHM